MARRGKRPETLRASVPGLRRVLRHLAPYLRGQRGLVAGGAAAMIAAVLAKLAEPWPLKFVIDHIVPVGAAQSGTGFPVLDALEPMTLLLVCAASLVVVIGLRAVFDYLATIAFALAGARVLTKVREDLFAHLQRLPQSFHTKARPGDLTVRLISDVGMLKETAVTAAMPLAVNALVLGGMLTIMLVLNWQLALIALSPLPLLWLSTLSFGRKIQTVSRKTRATEGAMAATASETMSGIRTIQALGLEGAMARAFGGDNAASLKQGVKSKRLAAGLERFVDLLVAVATALVLYFGTLFVLDGKLSPGDLLVFLTYLKNTFRPVRDYAKYAARLAKATAAGERVVELLTTPSDLPQAPDPVRPLKTRGALRFEDVHLSHEGKPVFRGLDLSIPAGQSVVITGGSGAGKSTLLGLALRLQDPDRGRVMLDGQDLRALDLAALRASYALVPQETVLFRATVAENLRQAAGREVSDELLEAAAILSGAHEFIAQLPEGYDTILTERGTTLSVGQRQRLSVARAILRNAPILVLDEPTVGLDSLSEAQVIDAIWLMARGRTALIVTHDLALARNADRVICLEDGRISGDGPHEQLLRQGGAYARLWHEQSGRHAAHAAE